MLGADRIPGRKLIAEANAKLRNELGIYGRAKDGLVMHAGDTFC
jgi:hypothetical protein